MSERKYYYKLKGKRKKYWEDEFHHVVPVFFPLELGVAFLTGPLKGSMFATRPKDMIWTPRSYVIWQIVRLHWWTVMVLWKSIRYRYPYRCKRWIIKVLRLEKPHNPDMPF